MISKFVIDGRLPSLNDYVRVNRQNKYEANNLKQETQKLINFYIKKYKVHKFDCPIFVAIRWYEKDMKRDYDNIVFAKKFILDSMVEMKIIPNDTRKYIYDMHEVVDVDKKNPRIEVFISTT